MLTRRRRLILVAIAGAVTITLFALDLAAGLGTSPFLVPLATLLAVIPFLELLFWLMMLTVTKTLARVRAGSGATVAGVVFTLGRSPRESLAALIDATIPWHGQVIIAPMPDSLQVWTADSKPAHLTSVPWQRVGPISAHGVSPLLLSPIIEIPYVSMERVHGVARLYLATERTDLATRRDAVEFVNALNTIRPAVV